MQKDLIPTEKVTNIFPRFMCKVLPLAFDESMSYYECICALLKKVNECINTLNNNSDSITELQNKYIELKNYVDNYFTNLDVQQEINNKLDQMVADGTLDNIINNYMNVEKNYISILDMIEDTSIILNQKIKCLGYMTLNDGYGGHFIIQNEGEIKLNNGLYAKFINNIENNYYDNITIEKLNRFNTTYYLTTIPLKDNNNNNIIPYIGVGKNATETPNVYSQNHNTNITINATVGVLGSDNTFRDGSVISNGEIVRNYIFSQHPEYENMKDNFLYLALNDNRDYKTYPGKSTAPELILSEGYNQAFMIYWELINNFNLVDNSNTTDNEGNKVNETKSIRQAIGFTEDKTIYIVTTEGRDITNPGMTSQDVALIMQALHCKNAFMLDGGGSTSTSFKGYKINQNYDRNKTQDRYIKYTLNVKNNIINKNTADIYSWIGNIKQKLFSDFMDIFPRAKNLSDKDCNELIGEFIIGYGNRMLNKPSSQSGYFINIPNPSNPNTETYINFNRQFYINAFNHSIFTRWKTELGWNEWTNLILPKILSANFTYNTDIPKDSTTWFTLPLNDIANQDSSMTITDNIIKINSEGVYTLTGVLTLFKNISGQVNLKIERIRNNVSKPLEWINQTFQQNTFQTLPLNASDYFLVNDQIKISINGNFEGSNDKIQRGNITIHEN